MNGNKIHFVCHLIWARTQIKVLQGFDFVFCLLQSSWPSFVYPLEKCTGKKMSVSLCSVHRSRSMTHSGWPEPTKERKGSSLNSPTSNWALPALGRVKWGHRLWPLTESCYSPIRSGCAPFTAEPLAPHNSPLLNRRNELGWAHRWRSNSVIFSRAASKQLSSSDV